MAGGEDEGKEVVKGDFRARTGACACVCGGSPLKTAGRVLCSNVCGPLYVSLAGGAGAVLAAMTDLTFNATGYAAVFGNDVCTALYLILIRHTKEKASLSTLGIMFYTSAMSLPVVAAALAMSNEPGGTAAYLPQGTVGFKVSARSQTLQ